MSLVHPVRPGPADLATGARAGVVGVIALALTASVPISLLFVLVAFALALDGLDGWLARRTHSVTEFGARFDMEVDAALILVLSLPVAARYGAWVLLIGLARYLWLLACWIAPALSRPVPVRRWRKAVAVLQAVALLLALTGLLGPRRTTELLAFALTALAVSFGTQAWEVTAGARRRHQAGSVLAFGALWLLLVVPADGRPVGLLDVARMPVELVALVGVGLVANRPIRRALVLLVTALLLLGSCLRALDAGFRLAFDRPFAPLDDAGYASSGLDWVRTAWGGTAALAVEIGVVLAVALLALTLGWAVRRIVGLAAGHRAAGLRAAVALSAAWLLLLPLGAHGGRPIASRDLVSSLDSHAVAFQSALAARQSFARQLAAPDPEPAPTLLAGHDVLLVFIESYGRVALGMPDVTAGLDRATRQLARSGYSARSGWLTSPTFGGLSWLAHSTLETGLWVDTQSKYDALLASDHGSLLKTFTSAGWRSACVIPADVQDWPQGQHFYHCQQVLDSRSLGYAGPRLGYPTVPDEFTLASFAHTQLGPGHSPVMAEIDLVTSHTPWHPLPRLLPWGGMGDGSVYAQQVDANLGTPSASYSRTIRYSWASLVRFLQHAADPGLTLIVLGDHQPNTSVSGYSAGHDVPISVISADPRVVQRLAPWGWTAGLRPTDQTAVWPMNAFHDRFLTTFAGP